MKDNYGSDMDAQKEARKHRRMKSARRVKLRWKEEKEARRSKMKERQERIEAGDKPKTAFDDMSCQPPTCEWLSFCRETDDTPLEKRTPGAQLTPEERRQREEARRIKRLRTARRVKARWKREERERKAARAARPLDHDETPFCAPLTAGCGPQKPEKTVRRPFAVEPQRGWTYQARGDLLLQGKGQPDIYGGTTPDEKQETVFSSLETPVGNEESRKPWDPNKKQRQPSGDMESWWSKEPEDKQNSLFSGSLSKSGMGDNGLETPSGQDFHAPKKSSRDSG